MLEEILMGFWNLIEQDRAALIDQNGTVITYKELQEKINDFKKLINSTNKQLGLVLCQNRSEDVIAYLSALQHKDAIILVDEKMNSSLLKNIINTYRPDWIATKLHLDDAHYVRERDIFIRKKRLERNIYPDLALLLATSGTTGSVKFVRLSYENLAANAASIAEYLQLDETERPILTLPMQYSYGLSVINSHLHVGATLLLTNETILSKAFWQFFKEGEATSFAGVPYTYEMLKRLRFERMTLPSLRTFTQAGGRLSPTLVEHFHKIALNNGQKFYVMYGQTEATARISYVPPERLHEKTNSIGIAIPNGELSLDEVTSELIYKGPNVMLGYAECSADLEKGDECKGVLYTGDLATVDYDGYFSIIGRRKRFLKIFGLRISLDEVERAIEHEFQLTVACTGTDEKMKVVVEDETKIADIKDMVVKKYGLHHSAFTVLAVEKIPRLANGKIDYEQIKDM